MIIKINKRKSVANEFRSLKRERSPVFSMKEFRHAPLVSFCISHKNRLSQLMETLPQNLDANRVDQEKIEFVLADYGSDEDVASWVWSNFESDVKSGYLKYFQGKINDRWNAPLAKNTTHRISSGKILVNLDGDNLTGYRGGMFVYEQFMSYPNDICLWQFSGKKQDGSFGRIAASRDSFFAVGGYNEEFLEMGFQDRDLVNRLEMRGSQVILELDDRYNQALENEKYEPEKMNYREMRTYNRFISKRLLNTESIIANNGKFGLEEVSMLVPGGKKFELKSIHEV